VPSPSVCEGRGLSVPSSRLNLGACVLQRYAVVGLFPQFRLAVTRIQPPVAPTSGIVSAPGCQPPSWSECRNSVGSGRARREREAERTVSPRGDEQRGSRRGPVEKARVARRLLSTERPHLGSLHGRAGSESAAASSTRGGAWRLLHRKQPQGGVADHRLASGVRWGSP
jgi:hypothetical protein